MKNYKRILGIVLTAVIAICAGCGSGTAKETSEKNTAEENSQDSGEESVDFQVALVLGTGGQGDGGFNDQLVNGVKMAQEEYGIQYQIVEPKEVSEFEGDYTDLSASGKYDLIVGGGFDQVETVESVAPEFSDQKYLFVDGAVTGCDDNVTSVTFRDNEKTYLVGLVAAMNSKTGTIGEVLAMNNPAQNVFAAGYMAGAKSVNPDIQVIVKYVGSFTDTNTAKELAVSEAEEGADIIYATAGGAGLGVFNAAADGSFYGIGVDVNQCTIDPDHIMLSSLRNVDTVIQNQIKAAMDGTIEGGVQTMGLAENALSITNESSNVEISEESLKAAEEAKQKIIDGEIVVPSTLDEVK